MLEAKSITTTENHFGQPIITGKKITTKVMSYFKGYDLRETNKDYRDGLTIRTKAFDDNWSRDAVVIENDRPIATYDRVYIGSNRETHYSLRKQLSENNYILLKLTVVGDENNAPQAITVDYKGNIGLPIEKLEMSELKDIAANFNL
jgi:hypothetical protein